MNTPQDIVQTAGYQECYATCYPGAFNSSPSWFSNAIRGTMAKAQCTQACIGEGIEDLENMERANLNIDTKYNEKKTVSWLLVAGSVLILIILAILTVKIVRA